MKVSIKRPFKSITQVQDFELPDFVVLTGKNGSGKSHLMELMTRRNDCSVVDDVGKQLQRIKYIRFGELNPKIDEKCEYLSFTSNQKQAWHKVKNKIDEYQNFKQNHNYSIDQYFSIGGDRRAVLEKWVELADGDVNSITEEWFNEHYKIPSNEILTSQMASIFKLYHTHLFDNDYRKYLNEKRGKSYPVLTDEEFEKEYGPKPWELINGMLLRAGLTYQVNHPEDSSRELDFILHLTDVNSGTEIQVNDLSTGEKVLMSLALSIYNTKEVTARPDILMLDEPDAALHPEYSKVLMDSVVESIVKEAGVKVIISTHSPMTVALAPEESIFLMDKRQGRPVKISKQNAVNILTRDLDNIRLSYEKRRQVFVESKYDVQYYNRIISLLSQELPTVPQFLPPKSSDGSNCDEVKGIVNELRRMGNDMVYGVIDFDGKHHSSNYILILGEGKRYAIDNYVFDPIFVAFLLIRKGILGTKDMGLEEYSFVKLQNLDDTEVQKMIDYVISELGFSTGNTVDYTVQSGKVFKATQEYFMCNGHDLETKIKDKWKPLNGIAHGGDNILKNYMLDKVCKEYPEYISMDFVDLFSSIS